MQCLADTAANLIARHDCAASILSLPFDGFTLAYAAGVAALAIAAKLAADFFF